MAFSLLLNRGSANFLKKLSYIPPEEDPNGDKLIGGVWNDPAADSTADSKKFCKKLEKLCQESGVRILTGTQVDDFCINSENGRISGIKATKKVAKLIFGQNGLKTSSF